MNKQKRKTRKPVPRCKECSKIFSNKHYICCLNCNGLFHVPCTTISEQRYNSFYATNKEKKGTWKCKICKENEAPNVNSVTEQKSNIVPDEPQGLDLTGDGNANSKSPFQEPSIDIVTKRKPKTNQSLSQENVTYTPTDNDTSVSTCDGGSPQSVKSLPNMTLLDLSEVMSLKDEVNQLTIQLLSAHNEIAKLNSQIVELNITVEACQKNINTYKKILTDSTPSKITPLKARSKLPKIHDSVKRNLQQFSPFHQKTSSQQSTPFSTPIAVSASKNKNTDNKDSQSKSATKKPVQTREATESKKNRIYLVSSNNTNKIRQLAEKELPKNLQICHFKMTNARITELFSNIKKKTEDLTENDYCIFLIGEEDFKQTNDYLNLVIHIRETLKNLNHTNFVICLPTYKYIHSELFNQRVEAFNNLLYLDVQTHQYAYLNDSNLELSYKSDMYFIRSGAVNDHGFKIMFKGLNKTINHIDLYNGTCNRSSERPEERNPESQHETDPEPDHDSTRIHNNNSRPHIEVIEGQHGSRDFTTRSESFIKT